jgi:hypothetical protein
MFTMKRALQKIFKNGFDDYKHSNGISIDQYSAAQAIMQCANDDLGYEEWVCHEDGYVERLNHSCRHRSCPRCNNGLTHDWLERTKERLIACDHYHVIISLPHELNELWKYNRHWCSDRLFNASVETLRELLSDEKYLGADVGIIGALHTWGRTLSFHPHLHLLVTGGGVSKDGEWKEAKRDFLLPVGVIKAKFRGKWMSWLNSAYANGDITLPEHWTEREWKHTLCKIAKKNWNVRIQGAYRDGKGVSNYLSRYVRGGPVKDAQIIRASDGQVSFRYLDHRDRESKIMTLKQSEFIGRVLSHVPEKGRHVVRYYGLYTPGAVKRRSVAREVLGLQVERRYQRKEKPHHCPHCGAILFHHLSGRCKSSYIRSHHVQQDVQADHDRPVGHSVRHFAMPPPVFFWPESGRLTQR